MRFRHHHLGRVLAAVGLVTGSFAFATAGPAAANVAEPVGERYEGSLYGGTHVPSALAFSVPVPDPETTRADPRTVKRTPTPSPAPPAPGPRGDGGSTAGTGGNTERLWLLGALALALAATGLVARAATRGGGDRPA
ncbi:hypothetical protein [Streptomyces sp. NPDC058664]|uniref:hypothetical protein n=1 Tax=unclassified Streptomyces TaxID=2593676 RepID=UPI00365F04F1